MAKKAQSGPGIREIIDDIKKEKFAPVYILHGEEPYYLDLISDNLEKRVVPHEDEREFNCDIFYGNDADIPYVIATARQFPTMAERRLVMLKEAQTMTKAKTQLDKFAPYLRKSNSSTVFVIVYKGEALAATSELMKAAKECGAVVFTSNLPSDWQIEVHVRDYMTQHKISMEEKALRMMIDAIGTPLSKFFGELQKLVTIKGPGNIITCEDVEKNIGISKEFNNFELVDAIVTRNYPKAVRIVKYLQKNPKTTQKTSPLMMVTSALFNFFSNLVAAHYLADKSDASIMAEFGFKSQFQVRNLKTGMQNYSPGKAVNAVHYLRDFDRESKGIGSNMKLEENLDELLFKIFT